MLLSNDSRNECSQVTKGVWRMFWRREAMKDVGRLRKAAVSRQPGIDPQISESGNGSGNTLISATEYIGCGGERGELKHLSTPRKRKKTRFPQ
jgi:hypothetical protein